MIVDFVDPLETKGPQPTMSADLQKALGAIDKGAQACMEALRARKKQLDVGETTTETVLKLIGHIKKVEEEEIEEDTEEANVVPTEGAGDERATEKDTAATGKDGGEQIVGGDTDDRSKRSETETGAKGGKKDESKKKLRSTPSAARLKEERCQAKIKEQ